MSTEINLAIKRKKTSTLLTTKKVKKLRLFSLIFLFGVGGLSVVLFLIIASSPLPSLRQQEQEASTVLTNKQAEFGKYLLLKKQLASIQSVLNARPNLASSIDVYLSLVPNGITASGVAISETTLSFSVSTTSLASLQSFFDLVTVKAEAKDVPANVTTSPIAYDATSGIYSFTIGFQ